MQLRPSENRIAWAYAALAFASLLWAGNAVVGRLVRADLSPLALAFWRWAAAFLLLAAFNLRALSASRRIVHREWRFLVAAGLLGMGAFHFLQYMALRDASALNVSIIVSFSPLLVFAAALCMGDEAMSIRRLAGLAASFAGVLAVVAQGELTAVMPLLPLRAGSGEKWMVLGICCWSAYSLLLKRRPPDLPAGVMTTAMAGVAAAGLLPWYLYSATQTGWPGFDGRFVLTVGYVALFASILAYSAYNFGVAVVGPSTASQFLNFCPLFTTLLSVAFLNEKVAWYQAGGFALVLCGFALTSAASAPQLSQRAVQVPR